MTKELIDLLEFIGIFVAMLAICEVLYQVSKLGMRSGRGQ